VGQATAETLRARGLPADLVPAESSQDGLIAAFAVIPLAGLQVLIPASSIGRAQIDAALQAQGAGVHRVVVYENRPPAPGTVEIPAAFAQGRIDTIVFASPSAVHNLFTLLGEERARQCLAPVAIAVIGPTTARAIEDLGLPVTIQPPAPHIPALVEAICAYYRPFSDKAMD
jgi:uroporphyrinogen-III synthase